MIVRVMQLGAIGTNCYILGDEKAGVCAVIDPGDDAPAVLGAVREMGLEIRDIFLTHGHYDHTGAVPAIHAAFPEVPIYIHRADASEEKHPPFVKLPYIDGRVFWDEGDTVTVGSLTVEVMHTPGHSKGSVVLRVQDVLFTGDTLFCGSMGRTDLEGGSYEEIMESLRRLAALPGDYQVCPGHEALSTLEKERKSNYFMREAAGR